MAMHQVYCHLDNDMKLARMPMSNCKSDMAIRSLTIRIYIQVTKDLNRYLMSHKDKKVTIIQKQQDNEEEQ